MKKICLITGATRGIGLVTAVGLAERGFHLVLVARSEQGGNDATLYIKSKVPQACVEVLPADLSSQLSIRKLAETYTQRYENLDVLINNVGVFTTDFQLTTDGIELQFAVNHLSYFLLTKLLLPTMQNTPGSRIINVSSRGHRYGRVRFDDLYGARNYNGLLAYAQSKLCNIMFTYGLARRMRGGTTTVNCLHPGSIRTEIGTKNSSGILHWIWKWHPFLRPVEQGAATSIYLASSPEAAGMNGRYFYNCRPSRSSAASYNIESSEKLWKVSEQLTGLNQAVISINTPAGGYIGQPLHTSS